jgi:hypothetical protein
LPSKEELEGKALPLPGAKRKLLSKYDVELLKEHCYNRETSNFYTEVILGKLQLPEDWPTVIKLIHRYEDGLSTLFKK